MVKLRIFSRENECFGVKLANLVVFKAVIKSIDLKIIIMLKKI